MRNTCTKLFSIWESIPTSLMPRRTVANMIIPFQDSASDAPEYKYEKKSPKETVLYVWGLGEHGALGQFLQKRKKMRNDYDHRFRTFNRPLRLVFGEKHRVRHVAAGYGFSAFGVRTKTKRKIYGTGLNTDSQIGYHEPSKKGPTTMVLAPVPVSIPFDNPKKAVITGLSAGRAHLAVCSNIGVFTLGNNAYGQCGRIIHDNENYESSHVVHHIKDLDGIKIKSVECGQDHTLFLMENGSVYSCGWSADGQTGLGHYRNQGIPCKVLGDIEGENIVKLSSKSDCVLALNDKGDVFGWGSSEYRQLYNENVPVQQVNRSMYLTKCKGFGKIVDIAAAGSHCIMLNEDGDVFTWGYGILGQGPAATYAWTPQIIPATLFGRNQFSPQTKVASIYCGLHHSAAVTNTGDIYIWGKNKGSCLGLGDDKDQFFPLRVSLSGICLTMSLGVDHTLALCKPF